VKYSEELIQDLISRPRPRPQPSGPPASGLDRGISRPRQKTRGLQCFTAVLPRPLGGFQEALRGRGGRRKGEGKRRNGKGSE